eukprot:IDg16520t1
MSELAQRDPHWGTSLGYTRYFLSCSFSFWLHTFLLHLEQRAMALPLPFPLLERVTLALHSLLEHSTVSLVSLSACFTASSTGVFLTGFFRLVLFLLVVIVGSLVLMPCRGFLCGVLFVTDSGVPGSSVQLRLGMAFGYSRRVSDSLRAFCAAMTTSSSSLSSRSSIMRIVPWLAGLDKRRLLLHCFT